MIGIGSDFHDQLSVGYNRLMIDQNRLRMFSSQQHLLAISAAFWYNFWQKTSFVYFDQYLIDAKFSID